ncbi:MAG: acetyltransferase [Chloroflexales bacterium]
MSHNAYSRCVILGSGGHARSLIDCMEQIGTRPWALLDPDPQRHGSHVFGIPIIGNDGLLPELSQLGADCFLIGVGSTGSNRVRQTLFHLAVAYLPPLVVVHPRAFCSPRAGIGAGVQIMAGGIVNAGAQLGKNVIINCGAIVEHDCVIGDHVHIATRAALAGGVSVATGACVGAGAVVRQGLIIGEGAVIGAGAVVIHEVPPYTVVAGVPARPIRRTLDALHMPYGEDVGH